MGARRNVTITDHSGLGLCTVESCDRRTLARGMCRAHYLRWHRHGDPLSGRATLDGAPLRYFNDVALPYEGDGCLEWPYSRDGRGYGHIWRDGRMQRVNRLVCEHRHGHPPTPGHEAAHNCGNRACVNPNHLRWATPVENCADKLIHGTHTRGERSGTAKLTESQAREILSLKGVVSQAALADRFGVAHVTISNIHRGETWAWLDGGAA